MCKYGWKIGLACIVIIPYVFIGVQGDINFSVKDWERLVTVVMENQSYSNFQMYDVNEDGLIDVRDLCLLYSKLSGEQNKNFSRKSIRLLEAILLRNCNFKSIIGVQNYQVKFSKKFLDNSIGNGTIFGNASKLLGKELIIKGFDCLKGTYTPVLVLRC